MMIMVMKRLIDDCDDGDGYDGDNDDDNVMRLVDDCDD